MDFNFWLLLGAAVFFSFGWIAARIDIKHLISESRALPDSYFRGLNFLLNDKPDKAIEAFIEVSKADTQTAELQFALGGLFRRRGEIDRAIRMHQSLVERSDIGKEEKTQALFELAQDYLKAGLLDRAEEVFFDLRGTSYGRQSLRYLLDIYMQEKEWAKAIDISKELEVSTSLDLQMDIANYYCEMAIDDHINSRPDSARANLDNALAANRKCVRANILKGEWQAKDGNHPAAIAAWKQIESQSPAHLCLVAENLLTSYKAQGLTGEGLQLLRGYQGRYPALDMLGVLFQATLEAEGAQAAYRLVRDDLRNNPSILGLDKLLEAQLMEAPPERRNDLQLIKNLVSSQVSRLARYQCKACGFKARQFYWHCPACGGWETFPPRRTAELEAGD
ncbi:MAG: lipopolysaccharide assembly protein LapB [Burkholderiales bacterium]|nr:lipopolysaccharide assembly protein LapB [Burkholderiales bacterium]